VRVGAPNQFRALAVQPQGWGVGNATGITAQVA